MDPYRRNMNRIVTVFGGSGFLGSHLVRVLAKRGWRIRVAVRNPNLANHLQPLGNVGQIIPIRADIRDQASVERAVEGAFAVVNLVGIPYENSARRFEQVHAAAPGLIGECAKRAGVERVAHVSAIGVGPDAPSEYGRTKAAGEQNLLAAFPSAIIFRPSLLFGPEDSFFNRFAAMARFSPVLPIVCGNTRFQPAYVADVATAIAAAVEGAGEPGTIYELGGPEIRTFREFLQMMLHVISRRRLIVSLPVSIANIEAAFLERLPGAPLLTRDQIASLTRDVVVSEAAKREGRTFAAFNVTPRAPSIVLPTYLTRFRRFGQFTERPRRLTGS